MGGGGGIRSLLSMDAIQILTPDARGGGGYYHYLLATKKNGGFHPVLNLRGLNPFLKIEKFRMETLVLILRDLSRLLDGITRPEGCLSSGLHLHISMKVPEILVEGSSENSPHLPGFAIRLSHGTQGLHQVAGSSGCLSTLQDHVYVPVHRQHLPCAGFSLFSGEDQGHQCSASPSSEFHDKSCQILTDSITGHDTPRRPHRHLNRYRQSYPR